MARRGRKEVVRKMIGYDLFRLTQQQINNRLDVAFFPTRVFPLDYHDFKVFCIHIIPKLSQLKLIEEFNMNINILSQKLKMNKKEREEFTTSNDILKSEKIEGKDRAICALKAYYDSTF